MKNIRRAFTLAELLIAMLVFAILAVLLVPNVTNNAERELFSTQLKKVQNDIQQAVLFVKSENQGSLQYFCSGGGDASECFLENCIMKKLERNVKFTNADMGGSNACNGANKTDKKNAQGQACVYSERNPLYMNKQPNNIPLPDANNFNVVYLKNGATVNVFFNPACNGQGVWGTNFITDAPFQQRICGYMEVDINAGKVPNVVGKDIHYFWIDRQDGIVPFGENDEFTCGDVDPDTGAIDPKPAKVNGQGNNLRGCTARMLQKNVPDYF